MTATVAERLDQLTHDQTVRLVAVIGALDAGHLGIGWTDDSTPRLIVTDDGALAVADSHPTKAALLAAGRHHAAHHGFTKPRSAADAAANPVLAALLLAHPNQAQGATQP